MMGAEAEGGDSDPALVAGAGYLDVRRTDLHSRFFQQFQYALASELLTDVERLSLDYDAFSGSRDAKGGYSGWLYWLLFLKGYTQFRSVGAIERANVYFRYLTLHYADHDADPTLRSLSNPTAAIERIGRRFGDCDQLSVPATAKAYAEKKLAPVQIYVRTPPTAEDVIVLRTVDAAEPIRARLVDGHHRLFAARLFGITRLRYRLRVEHPVPDMPGNIDHFSVHGTRLRLRGWVAPVPRDVHCLEVRWRDRTVCRARLSPRRVETAEAPDLAHGYKCDFDIDEQVTAAAYGHPELLDLMLLVDWLPIARLTINFGQRTAAAAPRNPEPAAPGEVPDESNIDTR